jgi:hypothetical protein
MKYPGHIFAENSLQAMAFNILSAINKLLKRIYKPLANPFVLAALLLPFAILFMPEASKYKLSLARERNLQNEWGAYHAQHYDLNGDGETELIQSAPNSRGDHGIPIRFANGRTLDQWNFPGTVPEYGHRMFIGDADNNGYAEVYAFTVIHDSLFLHYFEPMLDKGLYGEKVFVDKIRQVDGKIDFYLVMGGIFELDDSGYGLFTFAVAAGYSMMPRKVFAYCPKRNLMLKSPDLGADITRILPFNYPSTPNKGVLVSTYAPGNYKKTDTSFMHDQSAWMIVLDNNLQFLFEPVEYPGFGSAAILSMRQTNKETHIMSYSYNRANCDTCQHLTYYNFDGTVVKKINLENKFPEIPFQIISSNSNPTGFPIAYNFNTGKLFLIDSELNMDFYKQIPPDLSFYSDKYLFDFLNNQFYFCYAPDGIALISNDFRHVSYAVLPHSNFLDPPIVSLYFPYAGTAPQIAVLGASVLYYFEFSHNSFYYSRWLYLVGVYVFFVVLFWISRMAYLNQIKDRQKLEREISSLQFQTVSNQIDPHFIFNALNSITASIRGNMPEEAYNYGVKFSRLMREALLDSEQISRSLNKELSFVSDYLELERFRYKNSFDVKILVEGTVPQDVQIPKMIIQTFAENAVKHGLSPLEKDGLLHIGASMKGDTLLIVIEDNGVGRAQSKPDKGQSTGKGIAIIEKLSRLYHKLYKRKIVYRIIDLDKITHGQTGTRVEVGVGGDG